MSQCVVCSVQFAVCNVQCRVCNVQCAMCNALAECGKEGEAARGGRRQFTLIPNILMYFDHDNVDGDNVDHGNVEHDDFDHDN